MSATDLVRFRYTVNYSEGHVAVREGDRRCYHRKDAEWLEEQGLGVIEGPADWESPVTPTPGAGGAAPAGAPPGAPTSA